MMDGEDWTRNELILAINLYCKTQFGRIHQRNPQIIELAKIIGRTPGAVSYKMANIASLDESIPQKGAANASKRDRIVWNEFFENTENLAYESERLLSEYKNEAIPAIDIPDMDDIPEGRDRDQLVKNRVNQSFFRKTILACYDFKCCITEIAIPELLLASHIVPWSKDKANRLNPRNGLCLNALHDKAFDAGLITISDSFKIVVSESVKQRKSSDNEIAFLTKFDGKPIILPRKFQPDTNFLAYHRENIFKQ